MIIERLPIFRTQCSKRGINIGIIKRVAEDGWRLVVDVIFSFYAIDDKADI